MKKSFFAMICMVSMNLSAQTSGNNPAPLVSTIEPWKSNRYISWEVPANSTSAYKVNVYLFGPNGGRNGTLISSTWCDQNYYRFSPSEMASKDLKYVIVEYDAATGSILNQSQPAALADGPSLQERCYIDCNGKREAYRLSLWDRPLGGTYLSAGEAYREFDSVTSLYVPYYQPISLVSYNQLPAGHPYKRITGGIWLRDHIQITPNTPGAPFFDAMNNLVTSGWLIEKKMDKYMHFFGANSGTGGPTTAWCAADIGLATNTFNSYLDMGSLNGVTLDQTWFLTQIGTNGQGAPIYDIPEELECTSTYGGGSGGPGGTGVLGGSFGTLMDQMIECFETAADPLDCIEGGGFGGGFGGFTFESINNHTRFTASIGNDSGVISVNETTGNFSPGLFRINLFLTDGTIAPWYRVIGGTSVTDSMSLTIAPNPIVNSDLAFDVVSTTNKTVTLLVQKLDGTTVHAESVALTANTPLSRVIPITGTIPYNQLRVSVISPNGTSIQKTALIQ